MEPIYVGITRDLGRQLQAAADERLATARGLPSPPRLYPVPVPILGTAKGKARWIEFEIDESFDMGHPRVVATIINFHDGEYPDPFPNPDAFPATLTEWEVVEDVLTASVTLTDDHGTYPNENDFCEVDGGLWGGYHDRLDVTWWESNIDPETEEDNGQWRRRTRMTLTEISFDGNTLTLEGGTGDAFPELTGELEDGLEVTTLLSFCVWNTGNRYGGFWDGATGVTGAARLSPPKPASVYPMVPVQRDYRYYIDDLDCTLMVR